MASGRNYITFVSRLGASPGSVDGGIVSTGASAQTAHWMVIFILPFATPDQFFRRAARREGSCAVAN